MYKVDNAIIMAAGASSRFAPLSYERPKALIKVKNEILIERQIKQLQQAGISEIYIVVGYMAEKFRYLEEKFQVRLIKNDTYLFRNNHSSIYAARSVIRNTYICSADNYFEQNPFELEVDESYYAAVWSKGPTNEWCMAINDADYITNVEIGGRDAWCMLGHAFWSEPFSRRFLSILDTEYDLPQTKPLFWENIFINHINELDMRIRRYPDGYIYEFDTIAELRQFDVSYVTDTRSAILKEIARTLNGVEAQIKEITAYTGSNTTAEGIFFTFQGARYSYRYADRKIRRITDGESNP